MKNKKTRKIHKICNNVEYKTELHHTCNKSEICKEKINPDEACKDCVHYKLLEVEVAIEPIRDEFIWEF